MRVVTFGEVMLRLAPPEFLRVSQTIPGNLVATFGGGEVNVAVSIARQGQEAAYLTLLPDNPITDSFEQELRKMKVATDLVHRSKQGRFGIYFVETGANQRGGTVTYDREGSSIAIADPESYSWDKVFQGADWFHITGITPSLTERSAASSIASVREAKLRGLMVSCDLNFRKKLWRWRANTPPNALAQAIMGEMLPYIDLVIANEEDAELALGIHAEGTNVEAGQINLASYESVARQIVDRFPNVSRVAITLRESHSASHNNWGACLYETATKKLLAAPLDNHGNYSPYEIHNIVDRVGAGDSFAGALIFALRSKDLNEPLTALSYAVAASCLKHSIYGDFNHVSREEIIGLMKGGGSGRVQR